MNSSDKTLETEKTHEKVNTLSGPLVRALNRLPNKRSEYLIRPVGQAVKTLASHAGNMSSILIRVTNISQASCLEEPPVLLNQKGDFTKKLRFFSLISGFISEMRQSVASNSKE